MWLVNQINTTFFLAVHFLLAMVLADQIKYYFFLAVHFLLI